MTYDATDFVATETPAPVVDPKSITDPRERMAYLRDFLRALPERSPHYSYDSWHRTEVCGTACCIGGWAATFFLDAGRLYSIKEAAEDFGVPERLSDDLFFNGEGMSSTAHKAANVLDHYLATGEIDWSVA